jgi:hypothetical protein
MADLAYSARLGFVNERERAALVSVEPWGEEYSVEPGVKLEILAFSERAGVWFQVISREDGAQVYIEGGQHRVALSWEVYMDGVQVAAGPLRP